VAAEGKHFVMAIASFKFLERKKRITLLRLDSNFYDGLKGWLGAKVVYSVRSSKITIHTVMALLIVAVIYILFS